MTENDPILPHEIHITVDSVESAEKFREDCWDIGVKAIILDLHTKTSGVLRDMMTSETHKCTTLDAVKIMFDTAKMLTAKGYTVVRKKIEAAPWHPAAPTDQNQLSHNAGNYFESHVEVRIPAQLSIDALREALWGSAAHVSRSMFKTDTVMVTLRDNENTLEFFKGTLSCLTAGIENAGFEIAEPPIVEYAIFDTNVKHDAAWIA